MYLVVLTAGREFREYCMLIALDVDCEQRRQMFGLREDGTRMRFEWILPWRGGEIGWRWVSAPLVASANDCRRLRNHQDMRHPGRRVEFILNQDHAGFRGSVEAAINGVLQLQGSMAGGTAARVQITLLSSIFLLSFMVSVAPAQSSPDRVILYSFDGAAFDRTLKYMQEPTWPDTGLREMYSIGLKVDHTSATNPTLTAPSHISIHTGEFPDQHGVVGNYFHLPNTEINHGVSGFSAEFSVPSIWEQARAAGKRVGILSFPGADSINGNSRRQGDFGIIYNEREASAFDFKANAFQFKEVDDWDRSVSYSEPQFVPVKWTESAIQNGIRVDRDKIIYLITIDTTDDGVRNYDAVLWDLDKNPSNGSLTLPIRLGEWGNVVFKSDGKVKGAWTKLFKLESDLSHLRIYVGSLHHNQAYPDSFRDQLERNIGIWPGEPDSAIGELIDLQTWEEQAMRLSDWLSALFRYTISTQDFDLLIGYQPLVDEFGHKFLLTDRNQPEYTEENVLQAEASMRRAYLRMNDIVEEMMYLKGENTAIFVISDHGMQPIWNTAFPNIVLKNIGYISSENMDMGAKPVEGAQGAPRIGKQEAGIEGFYSQGSPIHLALRNPSEITEVLKDGARQADGRTIARVFSSGGFAHVYLNVKEREKNGVVIPGNDYNERLAKLKRVFERWEHKGKKVLELVLTREEASSLRLNHPNSGDLLLIASLGNHLGNSITGRTTVMDATFRGQHGFAARHSSMRPVFFAAGKGIPNKVVGMIHNVDIVPMLRVLLNIPVKKDVDVTAVHMRAKDILK